MSGSSTAEAELGMCLGCGLPQPVPARADGTIGECRRCSTVPRRDWPAAILCATAAAVAAVPLLLVGSTQTVAVV